MCLCDICKSAQGARRVLILRSTVVGALLGREIVSHQLDVCLACESLLERIDTPTMANLLQNLINEFKKLRGIQ